MSTPKLQTLLEQCCQPDAPALVEVDTLSETEEAQLTAALVERNIQARTINGTHLAGKADLLRDLAGAFGFPSYFGHNWDALIDCWSDMFWLPARGYVCVLLNAEAFAKIDPEAHKTLLSICQHVAERWLSHDDQMVFKLVRVAGLT